jgi:glucan biosynthesis protein C
MERFYYLDYLRAFAMVVGILVHVTTLAEFGWLELVAAASHNFRMGTFFAVSGFFAGLLLTRRSLRAFLGSRALALGLPLLVGLVVLNPPALWEVYVWNMGPTDAGRLGAVLMLSFDPGNPIGANFVWHLHLWFLISLLCYTLAAPLLWRGLGPAGAGPALGRIADRVPPALQATAVALTVAAAVVALRIVFSLTAKPFGAPWILLATLAYAPYYLLGLVLHALPRLWQRLHRIDLPLIALAAGFWAAAPLTAALPDALASVIDILRRELTVCAAFFALLMLSRRLVSGASRLGDLVSEGIYSAYLLHYLVIYTLALALRPLLPDGSVLQFCTIATLTLGLTLGLHHLVIKRVPVLLLLLNGRPVPKPRPALGQGA